MTQCFDINQVQSPRAPPRLDAVAMLQHVQRYKYGRRSPIVLRRHADRQTDRQQSVRQTRQTASGVGDGVLRLLRRRFLIVLAVQLAQRLELVNERPVLTLEHHDAHFQARDVLLLLPPTHACRLPASHPPAHPRSLRQWLQLFDRATTNRRPTSRPGCCPAA